MKKQLHINDCVNERLTEVHIDKSDESVVLLFGKDNFAVIRAKPIYDNYVELRLDNPGDSAHDDSLGINPHGFKDPIAIFGEEFVYDYDRRKEARHTSYEAVAEERARAEYEKLKKRFG